MSLGMIAYGIACGVVGSLLTVFFLVLLFAHGERELAESTIIDVEGSR